MCETLNKIEQICTDDNPHSKGVKLLASLVDDRIKIIHNNDKKITELLENLLTRFDNLDRHQQELQKEINRNFVERSECPVWQKKDDVIFYTTFRKRHPFIFFSSVVGMITSSLFLLKDNIIDNLNQIKKLIFNLF